MDPLEHGKRLARLRSCLVRSNVASPLKTRGWLLVLLVVASCEFPRPRDVVADDDDGDAAVDVTCQLTAIEPHVANTDDIVTLEGSFTEPVMVSFPGGISVKATMLGQRRATAPVPAMATAGDLTVSMCGSTFGPLDFRRASFATGLGTFQSRLDQTNVARQTPVLDTARGGHTSLVAGPFVYVVGGADSKGELGSVARATVHADGSLGSFSTLSGASLVTARQAHTTVRIGSYVYVIGGLHAGAALDSLERAPIASDGSLGSFASIADVSLTAQRHSHTSIVVGNYLYVLGGFNVTSLNSIERAVIHADGSLSPFMVVAGISLVGARYGHATLVVGSTLYVVGGARGNSALQDVERTAIDGEGSLGSFTTVDGVTLMAARSGHAAVILGGALYVLGGNRGNAVLNSVERAPLTGDGQIGAFVTMADTSLTTARHGSATAIVGDYLYVLGGAGAASLRTIERATLNASGSLGAFAIASGASLAGPRVGHVTVAVGQHAYAVGGLFRDIQRAAITSDGALGAFVVLPGVELGVARHSSSVVVVGANLYVIGGQDFQTLGSPTLGSIERAAIGAEGSLGAFSVASSALVNGRTGHASVVIGNYLYVIGGSAVGAGASSVERATINEDGSLGRFAAVPGVALTTARSGHTSVVLGGYLYVIGGSGETGVERAAIDADGSLSQFTIVPNVSLTAQRSGHTSAVIGSYLYVVGGSGGVAFSDSAERAKIAADGSLGQFSIVSGLKLMTARAEHSMLASGNYLYILGGRTFGSEILGSIERSILTADGSQGSFEPVGSW